MNWDLQNQIDPFNHSATSPLVDVALKLKLKLCNSHNASGAQFKIKMAGVGNVKTMQKFASVDTSMGSTILPVNLSKRKNILLISNGREFLYLVVDGSLSVSIYRRNDEAVCVRVIIKNSVSYLSMK